MIFVTVTVDFLNMSWVSRNGTIVSQRTTTVTCAIPLAKTRSTWFKNTHIHIALIIMHKTNRCNHYNAFLIRPTGQGLCHPSYKCEHPVAPQFRQLEWSYACRLGDDRPNITRTATVVFVNVLSKVVAFVTSSIVISDINGTDSSSEVARRQKNINRKSVRSFDLVTSFPVWGFLKQRKRFFTNNLTLWT